MKKISLAEDIFDKMAQLSTRRSCSVEEYVESVLKEYIENFEDFYKTDLSAVNKNERAYFVSEDNEKI